MLLKRVLIRRHLSLYKIFCSRSSSINNPQPIKKLVRKGKKKATAREERPPC